MFLKSSRCAVLRTGIHVTCTLHLLAFSHCSISEIIMLCCFEKRYSYATDLLVLSHCFAMSEMAEGSR